MKIISTDQIERGRKNAFFEQHWGSPKMVISSGVYDCSTMDGFAVLNENEEIIGLITYIIQEGDCEIISLDSTEEGKGIGTALIEKVEQTGLEQQCKRVKLITTNDNLHALNFYQKRGYQLSRLFVNAVAEARKLKPEIPLVSQDGIPIRDEIELVREL